MTQLLSVSLPDNLTIGGISSEWHMDTAACHRDDISYHYMSSRWLSWSWYLIRMSNDNVIMSSRWHTLPFLSHPDVIANFDFFTTCGGPSALPYNPTLNIALYFTSIQRLEHPMSMHVWAFWTLTLHHAGTKQVWRQTRRLWRLG